MSNINPLNTDRLDLDVLQTWVQPNSRVLDLGCGHGTLLQRLENNKHVKGLGLEIDPEKINHCLNLGLNVIEHNLDNGLEHFQTNSFDTVVMTQTLQAMRYPHKVLNEMLRVGKECIITFPNFGHWLSRYYLLTHGRMPVSKFMPYTWYDTPNIHFCTIRDFDNLCGKQGIKILHREVINPDNKKTVLTRTLPNLFASTAIYHVTK